MTTRPYRFQEEALRWLDYFDGRALLALEPGLGKTLISLLWAERNLGPEDGGVVVVCPASVKYHWLREAERHVRWQGVVLEGRTRLPPALDDARLLIVNYDVLRDWLPLLREKRTALLIVDESHFIKDPASQRSRATLALGEGVPHVLCLSGTPLVNRPIELFPTLNLLLPEEYASRWAFATRYCRPRRTPWGWKLDGAENLPELHRRLKRRCMVRMRKADVLPDLPPKAHHVVPLPLSDPGEYRRAEADFVGWLVATRRGRASKARRAERLVRFNGLKQLVGELKLPAAKEWLADYLEGAEGKLITFAVHRKVTAGLHQHFRGSVLVNGGVVGRARQEAVEKFTRDPRCRLFVGNVQAAGTGWPGQAASAVAFCELPWTPGELTQASDRPHRIGQRGCVDVFYLLAEGTIDGELCRLLQRKQRTLDDTLDGRRTADGAALLDLLEDRLTAGRRRAGRKS